MGGQIQVFVVLPLMAHLGTDRLPRRLADCQVNALQGLLASGRCPARHKTAEVKINAVKNRLGANLAVGHRARGRVKVRISKNLLNGLHPIGGNNTITIQTANDVSLGCVKASISGVYRPLALFCYKPHKREGAGDSGRTISGIIINDDDFERTNGLAGDRFQAGTQNIFFVERRNNNTYA